MGQTGMHVQPGPQSPGHTSLFSSKLTLGGHPSLGYTPADWLFFCLFLFRYTRFVVHTVTGIFLYRPSPEMPRPRYTGRDTAVIVPTVDPNSDELYRCLESVLQNAPRLLIVVTVGRLATVVEDRLSTENMRSRYPATTMYTLTSPVPSKRKQILIGLRGTEFSRTHRADLPIVLFAGDSVSWGPRFLPSLLAAFEDPQVGLVGTNKKVIRQRGGSLINNYTNFLASLYLCRHNFQIRSEPYLDGTLFVVSGRTCAVRADLVSDPAFRAGYQDERYCFGLRGPLDADDDNYLTRFALRRGWKIKIQYTAACRVTTRLGTHPPRFGRQLLRWGRTTWRSNTASLRRRHTWRAHPWGVYAVYASGLVNFALVWDPLLVWALRGTSAYQRAVAAGGSSPGFVTGVLVAWILASKLVKIAPHFWEHPGDLILLPGHFVFAYAHSLIKLYCGLTFWDHSWSGRDLAAVKG